MPTPRKAPRRTRERILEAALRLFNEHGEPRVTTAAIAEGAGISPGNLYYHFRSKDQILEALWLRHESDLDPVLALPDGGGAHAEDAWLFLHLLFEAIWRHRFAYRDLGDLLARHPRLATRLRELLARTTDALQRLCDGLSVSGGLQADPIGTRVLATNMVVVATWWLSYEQVLAPRGEHAAADPSGAIGRGAFQVLSLAAASLRGDARALLERRAAEYLRG